MSKYVTTCVHLASSKVHLWLKDISDGLDLSCTIALTDERIERPVIMYDERIQKLASEALLMLPAPMRTLLTALSALKQDKVRDMCRQISDYELKAIVLMQSRIDYACASLDACSKGISMALANGQKAYKDEALRLSVMECLGSSIAEDSSPNDWHVALLAHVRRLQENAHMSMLSSFEREPQRAKPISNESTQGALEAIAETERVRQRLKALAEGQFTELYEHKTAANKGPQDTSVTEPKSKKIIVDFDIIIKAKSLLRRVRTVLDDIKRDESISIRDEIGACVKGIRNSKFTVEGLKIEEHADMVSADKSLQREISFMLNTITVDTKALDLVLRSIRSACDGIEETMALESTGAWAIRLATWQLRLTEAIVKFNESLN